MSDKDVPEQKVAVGISFGNSYSSIAYTSPDGKSEVITNEEGDRQIPSILSYAQGEEFQGTQAKELLVRNSGNTVAWFRDFLGKDFKSIDPTPCHAVAHPQEYQNSVAFSIQDTDLPEDSDQDPPGPSTVPVTDITTRYLRRLKLSASDYLGKDVSSAVITVPTNFSDAQKCALRSAAMAADLEILQLIHEPVAVALAYDSRPNAHTTMNGDKKGPADEIIVVADLGGTRSDVTVMASRGGLYTILSTSHDYDVAGVVLDMVLVDHVAKEFLKKHKSATDPRLSPRVLAKTKLECEAVKKALSVSMSSNFSVENFIDDIDFNLTINRSRFDLLTIKHVAAFVRLVQGAVAKANLDPLDVDTIILAGGTAHVPKICRAIQCAFLGNEHTAAKIKHRPRVLSPTTSREEIDPSILGPYELAVCGAAIQARLLAEYYRTDIGKSSHLDDTVSPHLSSAIGFVVCDSDDTAPTEPNIFIPVILPATPVPVRRTAVMVTPSCRNTKEDADPVQEKDGENTGFLVRICEADAKISISKPEPKVKQGRVTIEGQEEAGNEVNPTSESDEDEEDVRERGWNVGKVLAEVGIKLVGKGEIEIQINVRADLSVEAIVREVGVKDGVQGIIQGLSE